MTYVLPRLLPSGLFWIALTSVALTQLPSGLPTPSSMMPTPKSYSDYYAEQLHNRPVPMPNVYNYTIDRYYYHNPSLSPYLNLTRRGTGNQLNNYYRYVRPEIDRRSAPAAPSHHTLAAPAPSLPAPNPGHVPTQTMNPYFQQYYHQAPLAPTPLPPKLPPQPLPKLF